MDRRSTLRTLARFGALLVTIAALVIPLAPLRIGDTASHREAPLISLDPEADITDTFFFRSYESGKADKVVMAMDVIPGEDPSSGPNYRNFDPAVRYAFNLDTNADGVAEDVVFDFQFSTELRGTCDRLGLPLSYVALPPITNLDGAGSEGRTYSPPTARARTTRPSPSSASTPTPAAAP